MRGSHIYINGLDKYHGDPCVYAGEEGIVMLEPGGHATLALPSVVSPSCQSQLASCPELFFEEDQVSTLAASGSLAALQKAINGR